MKTQLEIQGQAVREHEDGGKTTQTKGTYRGYKFNYRMETDANGKIEYFSGSVELGQYKRVDLSTEIGKSLYPEAITVNWSAMGSRETKEAREYANAILVAADLADELTKLYF